jgi:hypothetical protein
LEVAGIRTERLKGTTDDLAIARSHEARLLRTRILESEWKKL